MTITGKWRVRKIDEFGNVGLEIVTRCSFCPEFYEGHRDKGISWFKKHMKQEHNEILKTQVITPRGRKRSYKSDFKK